MIRVDELRTILQACNSLRVTPRAERNSIRFSVPIVLATWLRRGKTEMNSFHH